MIIDTLHTTFSTLHCWWHNEKAIVESVDSFPNKFNQPSHGFLSKGGEILILIIISMERIQLSW